MLDSLLSLYRQLGGLGTAITLLIILVFIGAVYANILTRRKYISLSEELAGFCAGEYKEFHSDLLKWVTDEYKEAAQSGIVNINTPSIIDTGFQAYLKPCTLAESFIKKSNALLITTGLLGTFIGLTYAVGNIGSILNNTGAEALMSESGADTLTILVSSFQGMAVAFVTSLFGTGFSILNMVFTSLFSASAAKKLLIAQLEEFLDIKLASEIQETVNKEKETDQVKIKQSADALISSLNVFHRTVNDFTASFKDLKSFNGEFSHNMEQVKTSFSLLCNAMDKTSESSYESGLHLYNASETLKALTQQFTIENDRLRHLTGVLDKLHSLVDENRQDRAVFIKTLYEIPDKLLNYHEAAVARADRKGVSP